MPGAMPTCVLRVAAKAAEDDKQGPERDHGLDCHTHDCEIKGFAVGGPRSPEGC